MPGTGGTEVNDSQPWVNGRELMPGLGEKIVRTRSRFQGYIDADMDILSLKA